MIKYKTEEEIAIMREGGKIHARILKEVAKKVKPGVKTDALNTYAEQLIDEAGCTASFLGYQPYDAKKPYPAALCVSINEEIVHGIPNEGGRILFENFKLKIENYLVKTSTPFDEIATVCSK